VSARTHSLTSPCSHNGSTAHDETGVEAEVRSRWDDIPRQSQRHEGVNVAVEVKTGVDSEKTIAPGCGGSRTRGGCKENGPRAIWLIEFWCLMNNTICELISFLVFVFVVHRIQRELDQGNEDATPQKKT
jgi:hypothetical protein